MNPTHDRQTVTTFESGIVMQGLRTRRRAALSALRVVPAPGAVRQSTQSRSGIRVLLCDDGTVRSCV